MLLNSTTSTRETSLGKLQSNELPAKGSYLEIRRGRYLVVARVVWASSIWFGVQTQDRILAADLFEGGEAVAPISNSPVERRRAPRAYDNLYDQSRWRSKAFDFTAIGLFGAMGAWAALMAVDAVLARPLVAISGALKG